MSKRTKYSAEEKYKIIMTYEDGIESMLNIASMYKVNEETLRSWRYNFEKYGLDGLRESKTWKPYSKELREKAIMDYLSGEYSLREVRKKYEISSKSVLQQWLNKYNGHREITSPSKGMSQSMTKGRSTSWKERIEIVLYCLAHDKDFQSAAEVYHVSYQQVYQWVKKYEACEEDALTPEDRVNLEMKKLKTENERLRAENAFLKKLEELEGRRF